MSSKKKISKKEIKKEKIIEDSSKKEKDVTDDLLEQTLHGLKSQSDISPDLDNFFDEVKEKKKMIEEDQKNNEIEENLDETTEYEQIDENDKPKKKKKNSKFKVFSLLVAFTFVLLYYLLNLKSALVSVDYIKNIITSSALLLTFFFIILALVGNRKTRNTFSILSSIIIIGIVSLNILYSKDMVKLPTLTIVDDFTNETIANVIKWANENDIKLNQNYEYSDNVDDGNIIMQSIEPGTVLKLVDEITVTISNGPNYDKELILKAWVGRNVDDLIEYINENHLNNTEINFEINNDIERDSIINQSIKGEIKRNTPIKFAVSLGKANELNDLDIDDIENKTLFDATLYLKRNGIRYEISYDFSDLVKKNRVISQSIKKGNRVSLKKDTVKLVISKGKEIKVPDFGKASVDEVVDWIIDNNLKVDFSEKYSKDVDEGKIISLNVKTGDSITEGTKVIIVTSKGALTVPSFKSLNDAKSWASNNGVTITEKYEYSDKARGSIISQSIKEGEKIDPVKDAITITLSNGSPSIVPYVIGKDRGTVQSLCNNTGLNCSFYYTGYSSQARDTATTQSLYSGAKVLNGTYMSIGLSSGPAKTFTITIDESLYQPGSADGTIASIRSYLASVAPDVYFDFVKKPSNIAAGYIPGDSPIKGGVPYNVTQGQTYRIYITN